MVWTDTTWTEIIQWPGQTCYEDTSIVPPQPNATYETRVYKAWSYICSQSTPNKECRSGHGLAVANPPRDAVGECDSSWEFSWCLWNSDTREFGYGRHYDSRWWRYTGQ